MLAEQGKVSDSQLICSHKNFPVDCTRFDGCFVRDIVNDKTDSAFVGSTNQVASFMGLATIAEDVENDALLPG